MSPDPTITFETPSHCDGSGHRPLQKGEHHSDALSSRHHRCIKGHRDLRRLRCWGETVDPTVGPGSQGRFALGLIHAPKERVVRGGTGGDVGEAKGWASRGSCTCPMRINIADSPVDRHRGKKA